MTPVMTTWTIEKAWENWWSLKRNGLDPGWASVEGDEEEWAGIAKAIETESSVHFKRCSAQREGYSYVLSSPRNAVGKGDYHWLNAEEAKGLAAAIRAVLSTTSKPQNASAPPVITDPEEFDIDRHDNGIRLRIDRGRRCLADGLVFVSQTGPYQELELSLDQLRWLRDRFNEILEETHPQLGRFFYDLAQWAAMAAVVSQLRNVKAAMVDELKGMLLRTENEILGEVPR